MGSAKAARTVLHWRRGSGKRSRPPWIADIERGDDEGFFGPESASWAVNGSLTTFVGGIRALLIQLLHPGALAGVYDHSRFRSDPLGRLNRTIAWLALTTFGSREAATDAAAHVRRMHLPVHGTYATATNEERSYSANDSDLSLWVHTAFTTAFLGAFTALRGNPPGGRDGYVSEWAVAGRLMGVDDPPRDYAELIAVMRSFDQDLTFDERAADVARFLRRPPLPLPYRLIFPVLFGAAVATLPTGYRALLGLKRPKWPAITLARVTLALAAIAVGTRSPSERAARERISRSPVQSA
ncbi:oxygenase MpaB family protein [Leifsonia lichenia]